MPTPQGLSSSLASVVRSKIATAGLTLREVVDATDIPIATLHRRLNRPEKYPFDLAEITAVADMLGTRTSRLVRQAEEEAQRRSAAA